MDLTQYIEELKKLTLQKDISLVVPFEYFIKHFTQNSEALKQGKPCSKENNKFFKKLLKPILNNFREELEISKMVLLQIKQFDFVHGIVLLSNGIPIILYYFEELVLGLVVVPGINNMYYRLTGMMSDKINKSAIIPHKGSQTLH